MGYNKERLCKKCNIIYLAKQHNSLYCKNCKEKNKIINRKIKCTICNIVFSPVNSTHKKYCVDCKKIYFKKIKNKNWNLWYRKQKGYEPVKEIKCMICDNIFLR